MDISPVPFGALRAAFRDPSADDGLMVRPVVGFVAPPRPGGAAVFGGYEVQAYAGPPPAANEGVHGVPVVMTRRGELRTVRTRFTSSGPEDVQDAAPADVGLVEGVMPGPEFLGLVQTHEDAAVVFRPQLEAADAHRADVERLEAAQAARAVTPPTDVDADVANTPVPAIAAEMRRDLETLLASARAMTTNTTEKGH